MPQRLVVWVFGGLIGFQVLAGVLDVTTCTLITMSYLNRPGVVEAEAEFCDDTHERVNEAVKDILNIVASLLVGGVVGASHVVKTAKRNSQKEKGQE